MLRLLADVHAEGHLAAVVRAAESGVWRELWFDLGVEICRFADVSLPANAPDDVIWRFCQDRGYVLVTANRNDDGPDSLQAAIRERSDVDSLPVLTLADARRLSRDRIYLDAAAAKRIDVLTDLDRFRGSGRLFLP